MKNDFWFHLSSMLFPVRCPICDKIVQRRSAFCDDCRKNVRRIENICLGCGRPRSCCSCTRQRFKLKLTAPFVYTGNVRRAIHRFKFNNERALADFFAADMVQCVKRDFSEVKFDVVTCVPQTRLKRYRRGFNQSALLAKKCGRQMNVCCEDTLLKIRNTKDQHKLKAKERRDNLKGAFSIKEQGKIEGKTVLLCDDIKTTGATLNECRKTLLKSGARAVYCVTAAVVSEE